MGTGCRPRAPCGRCVAARAGLVLGPTSRGPRGAQSGFATLGSRPRERVVFINERRPPPRRSSLRARPLPGGESREPHPPQSVIGSPAPRPPPCLEAQPPAHALKTQAQCRSPRGFLQGVGQPPSAPPTRLGTGRPFLSQSEFWASGEFPHNQGRRGRADACFHPAASSPLSFKCLNPGPEPQVQRSAGPFRAWEELQAPAPSLACARGGG